MVRATLLLAMVMAALAAVPTGAHAAGLTLRDTGMTGSAFRTDGERYIAAATGPREVTVLDIRAGTRVVLSSPQDCELADVHDGAVLWTCDRLPTAGYGFDSGLIVDLKTGTRRLLAQAPVPAGDFNAETGRYIALGERFVQSSYVGYHVSGRLYTDLISGQVRRVRDRRDRVVELDGPDLTRRLCNGQRRPLVSDINGLELVPGQHATAGRWAAATTYSEQGAYARVQLQRCGHPTRTLRRCHTRTIHCSDPVIDDRLVAWEERPRLPGPLSLTVRWHRSGRVQRVASGASGLTPLLVGGRLYLVRATPVGSQPLAPVELRLMRAVLRADAQPPG